MARPRTLIAHPHRLFLSGLELLLADDFDVVYSTADFTAVVEAVRNFAPSLVVQGLSDQPQVGLELIAEIRQAMPETRVAVLTRWDDATLAVEAFQRGASAYIPQTSSESELLDGLRAAAEDSTYVTSDLTGRMLSSLLGDKPDAAAPLSERQIEIVKLLATGKSMKEVAGALNITTRTVAFHKYAVMRLLNIKSSAELVRYAIEQKLA